MLRHGARGEDFVSGHDRGTQGHPWVACRKWLKINVGFAGCGKTRSGAQEASGHDFSRAVSAAESIRASAPAVCFSGISVGFGPFSAACLAPDDRFSRILPEIGPFSAACLAPEGIFHVHTHPFALAAPLAGTRLIFILQNLTAARRKMVHRGQMEKPRQFRTTKSAM